MRFFPTQLRQFQQKHGKSLVAVAITGTVALGILGLRSIGTWESLEVLTLDYLWRSRPGEAKDDRIVIVEVNDADIQRARKSGLAPKWSWSDRIFAKILNKIAAAQPIAIGFDKFLDIPTQEGRAELIQAIAQAKPVINVTLFPQSHQLGAVELAPDLAKISSPGFANMITESGGMVHRALLGTDTEVSFAYLLTQEYLSKRHQQVMEFDPQTQKLHFGNITVPRFTSNYGGYHHEDAQGYQVLINYRNHPQAFQRISAMDLLEGKKIKTLDGRKVEARELMRDRLVLVGITAESVKDRLPTPFSIFEGNTTAGVEIHAHIISQLISRFEDGRPLIQVWAEVWESLWILVWVILGGTLATFVPAVSRNLSLLLGLIVTLISATYIAFVAFCLWLPFFPAIAGLILANIAIFSYQFSQEQADRQLLMGMFSRHVSKELVDVLWTSRQAFLQDGRIEGQEVYVTVLFTDMRNFSTAAEAQKPGDTLTWLNSYLGAIAAEVISHNGMVDKYIGDAVMAVFGVPIPHFSEAERSKDAQNAVRAALQMANKLAAMNDQWQAQGLPEVVTGIGINSGMVIAGSLGSCERLEYSVIGDAVNVAARLESFNKEVDGGKHHILISEDTYLRLDDKFQTDFVGEFELKGRKATTSVYRVLAEA